MVPEGCNVENYNPLSKFLKELQLIETQSLVCLFFKQTIYIFAVSREKISEVVISDWIQTMFLERIFLEIIFMITNL